jgi:hypothetical protein
MLSTLRVIAFMPSTLRVIAFKLSTFRVIAFMLSVMAPYRLPVYAGHKTQPQRDRNTHILFSSL